MALGCKKEQIEPLDRRERFNTIPVFSPLVADSLKGRSIVPQKPLDEFACRLLVIVIIYYQSFIPIRKPRRSTSIERVLQKIPDISHPSEATLCEFSFLCCYLAVALRLQRLAEHWSGYFLGLSWPPLQRFTYFSRPREVRQANDCPTQIEPLALVLEEQGA